MRFVRATEVRAGWLIATPMGITATARVMETTTGTREVALAVKYTDFDSDHLYYRQFNKDSEVLVVSEGEGDENAVGRVADLPAR